MSIFKAYDIRGVYPDEITPEVVRKIGFCLVGLTGAKTIAVGRDMRESGEILFRALCEGIAVAGAKIVDIGLVSTPLFYFSVRNFSEHDAGVMITASHNPAQYNGLKMVYKDAMPIGKGSGMEELEKMVLETKEIKSLEYQIEKKDTLTKYIDKLFSFVNPKEINPLRVVVDAGNGMAGHVVPRVFEKLSCQMIPLYFELDGSFPNHEANPIKPENMRDLQKKVLEKNADIGIAYDGDADRIGFVDEKGEIVAGDIIGAIIAKEILKNNNGAKILFDLRGTKAVRETVEKNNGKFEMSRVGHAFIKNKMKETGAIFAGELSSHFYFDEFGRMDTSDYAMLIILKILSKERRSFSEIAREIKKYAHSGEINFEVKDKEKIMQKLIDEYKNKSIRFDDFDGIRFEFEDWWFSVRPSNTEPALRLNLEADTEEIMETRKTEIVDKINN